MTLHCRTVRPVCLSVLLSVCLSPLLHFCLRLFSYSFFLCFISSLSTSHKITKFLLFTYLCNVSSCIYPYFMSPYIFLFFFMSSFICIYLFIYVYFFLHTCLALKKSINERSETKCTVTFARCC